MAEWAALANCVQLQRGGSAPLEKRSDQSMILSRSISQAYHSVRGVPVMALRTRQPFQIPHEAVQPASTCGAARAVALMTLRRVMMLVNCISEVAK